MLAIIVVLKPSSGAAQTASTLFYFRRRADRERRSILRQRQGTASCVIQGILGWYQELEPDRAHHQCSRDVIDYGICFSASPAFWAICESVENGVGFGRDAR